MTNKQLINRYKQYQNSNYYTVCDLYKNCSYYKRQAEQTIENTMKDVKGFGYKVIAGNSSHFTAGWMKKENGRLIFVFETWKNTYTLDVGIA